LDAGYGFAGNSVAGYGVIGVLVISDVLPATGSLITVEILINTPMYCMFS
jgi:hypothetical protein